MTELNTGSIESDLYLRVRSGLNANLVSGYINGVYPAFPDSSSKDFPGYPVMVLRTSTDRNNLSFSGLHVYGVNIDLTCYGTSSQGVVEAIQKASNVLDDGQVSLGFQIQKNTSSSINHSFIGGNKVIHQKDLVIEGVTRQWIRWLTNDECWDY